MRDKHLAFWTDAHIQEFWSGCAFRRADDGNLLSYDLASIMVKHLAQDWPRFQRFVLNADWADAGARSARQHLGLELGELVGALLDQPDAHRWSPQAVSTAGETGTQVD